MFSRGTFEALLAVWQVCAAGTRGSVASGHEKIGRDGRSAMRNLSAAALCRIVASGVSCVLLPAALQAQTAAPAPASLELAEVVVTAEKRTETVQSTPISVTAIT